MFFRACILVFFVLLRLFSFAQVEVKGNLLKIQGDPLQNHPVYLFDRYGFLEETTTNESGYYIFDVNDASDILIVKTVGFCGFWETYSDTVNLDEGNAFEINFSICYNSTPHACNSNFIARPQSHFNFLFSSLIHPNEFINYQWDFGDGETATSAEVEHIYEDRGIYSVRLITENPMGCTDTVIKEVLVGPESFVRGRIETNDNFLSNAFIWLIGFDFDQNQVVSTIVPDQHGKFKFWCKSHSKYLVKLVPDFGISNYSPRLLPTYLGNAYYWQDADVLNIGHEIRDLTLVTLESDFIPHGFNEIHGHIKNNQSNAELPLTVYLLDEYREPIDFAKVKDDKFDFENLPAGTYYVLPELAGKVSFPLKVEFEGDFEPPANPRFKIGTTQINPLVGLEQLDVSDEYVELSPIPVKDLLHVRSKFPIHKVWIYNVNGCVLKEKNIFGDKNAEISVHDLKKGTYFIRYIVGNEYHGGSVFVK